MKKLLLLGAAVFALQAVPAFAEDAVPAVKHAPRAGMFEKQDTDKDGAISETEFLNGAKERFAAMDANKDGKITKEEAKAHHDAMKAKWKEKRGEMKGHKDGAAAPAAPAAE